MFTAAVAYELGDKSKIRFSKAKWVDYEQLSYMVPTIFEVSRWKVISVKATYRRESYRVASFNNGDFRIHEQKRMILVGIGEVAPQRDKSDNPIWL